MAEENRIAKFLKQARLKLGNRAFFLIGWVALLWAIEIMDLFLFFVDFDRFGIRPRVLTGLIGIPLAPFLHVGFAHLAANTLPLLLLGGLTLMNGAARFWTVTLAIVLASGAGIWLIGRTGSVHVGASGLIFGYLGYLLAQGYLARKTLWVLGSVVAAIIYGSLLWGMLQSRADVSWEGHVFGFLGGIGAAWTMGRPRRLT